VKEKADMFLNRAGSKRTAAKQQKSILEANNEKGNNLGWYL